MPNHIAVNLVTKGLLNISNITKGMLLVNYVIIFKRRGGGGGYANPPLHYDNDEALFKKIREQNEDEIDSIKVYVDWQRVGRGFRKVEANLIKHRIEAQILNETGKNITVEVVNPTL